MILQEKLDALRSDFEAGRFPLVPTAAQIKTMERATNELIASGQAARALKKGDRAPDFELHDPDGISVKLCDLLAAGPLVLTFYRGVWCPYCNLDLGALEAVRPALEALGARLVAISPQTAANSRKSQRDNNLNFPIPVVVNKDVASSHAAFLNSSGNFRSGFSQTSSFISQSRVAQRSGRRCFAASRPSWRCTGVTNFKPLCLC